MLFNSQVFIFCFLPLTLIGFFWFAQQFSPKAARLWLTAASLVFYGWWSVPYLLLLVAWIAGNYLVITRMIAVKQDRPEASRPWMITAVSVNLGLLAYFKYMTFIADSAEALTGFDFAIGKILLPLAISFHTFQQVACIIDVHRGEIRRYSFADYLLFVTFFPQLIAGPIVHHRETMPQFADPSIYKPNPTDLSAGLAFFVIGLIKKLCLADPLSALARPVFFATGPVEPGFFEAWTAALAFGLGLYFDFSAYSDMAIGLARMFGVHLPYNFASPYKATSIIDFWRRWHITLSRWLRDYLYISLGGNRRGPVRRHANLLITMLLGGLWHGAAWTFVIWGGLHGLFLIINHAWDKLVGAQSGRERPWKLPPLAAQALTFLAVTIAWVFFAAQDLGTAGQVLMAMAGFSGWLEGTSGGVLLAGLLAQGIALDDPEFVTALKSLVKATGLIGLSLAVVLVLPNSQQIVDGQTGRSGRFVDWNWLVFKPTPANAVVTACAFLVAIALVGDVKEFVYFQF